MWQRKRIRTKDSRSGIEALRHIPVGSRLRTAAPQIHTQKTKRDVILFRSLRYSIELLGIGVADLSAHYLADRRGFRPPESAECIGRTNPAMPEFQILGLRSCCERAEFILALVMRLAPVSTLAGTCSPRAAASAVLTPS